MTTFLIISGVLHVITISMVAYHHYALRQICRSVLHTMEATNASLKRERDALQDEVMRLEAKV